YSFEKSGRRSEVARQKAAPSSYRVGYRPPAYFDLLLLSLRRLRGQLRGLRAVPDGAIGRLRRWRFFTLIAPGRLEEVRRFDERLIALLGREPVQIHEAFVFVESPVEALAHEAVVRLVVILESLEQELTRFGSGIGFLVVRDLFAFEHQDATLAT